MQPKKSIRQRENHGMIEERDYSQVLLSVESPASNDYRNQSIARQTFKPGSPAFKALEQTHLFGEGLVMREEENEETGEKFTLLDLDDEQGADVCKAYLCSLERLACSMALELSSRTYRQQFTNSYKVLYQQMRDQFGSQAAYLPEILDSAQESFDHLWVNGEKYVFSDHVVESGTLLSTHFTALRDYITSFYQKYYEIDGNKGSLDEALAKDLQQLKQMLVKFDDLWTQYESKYVGELMVIEGDARRFIVESISLERELGQKRMQLPEMQTKVQETRASLLDNICKVNAVANVEGKGRDDFKLSLLQYAEKLL